MGEHIVRGRTRRIALEAMAVRKDYSELSETWDYGCFGFQGNYLQKPSKSADDMVMYMQVTFLTI